MRELDYEIALLLQGAGIGQFTPVTGDRNIYVGEMPEGVNEGILIVAVVSPPPHDYVDTEYTVLDFWAKSAHSDRARSLLKQVEELLHRNYDYETANWHVYFSRSLGSIVDADRNIEGSKLFRLGVQFICRNLNHVS